MKINYRIKRITNGILVTSIVMAMLLGETQLGNMPYVVYASEAPVEISEEATTSEISTEEETEVTTEVSTDETASEQQQTTIEDITDEQNNTTSETISTEEIHTMENSTNQFNGVQTTSDDISTFVEDMVLTSDTVLTEDTVVKNLDMGYSVDLDLNGYNLIVEENCNIDSGKIVFNGGELLCYGDLTIDNYDQLVMNTLNDYLTVHGNFTNYGLYSIDSGTIEVKGDFIADKNFTVGEENTFVFSGQSMQKITLIEGTSFNNVCLQNYSADGLYITYSFRYNKLIDDGCVINYANLGGIRGTTLAEDTTYDGLYYLVSDTLDLNGKTLTINGDLVQSAGVIDVNGGKLIINGSYRMQTMDEDVDGNIIYSESKGTLLMDSAEDYVYIANDYINKTTISHKGNLTDGVIEIGGDFMAESSTYSAFGPSNNHTVIMSGNRVQNINLCVQDNGKIIKQYINNIVINNESEEGICFENSTYISGHIKHNEANISGSIILKETTSFENNMYDGDVELYTGITSVDATKPITIDGNVKMASDCTLKNDMVINGNIYCDEGTSYKISVEDANLTISGNSDNVIYYPSRDAYVCICGDFTNKINIVNKQGGTIELKGNIHLAKSWIAYSPSRIILGGDKLQKVTGAKYLDMSTVEIRNYSDEGVYFDTQFYKDEFIGNGCKVTYGDIDGEFGWTLQEDTVWEGDLTLVDDEMNLNGHSLTINGNLIQASGNMNINGGSLIVNGDYKMQFVSDKTDEGTVRTGSSKITMINENDYIRVEGDFLYDSNTRNVLKAGTLEIKGGFTTTKNSEWFLTYETHKLVIAGTEQQNIEFNKRAIIENLIFDNASEEGVLLKGEPEVSYVDSGNTNISGAISIVDEVIFENNQFNGDIIINDKIDFTTKLTVKGDFINNDIFSLKTSGSLYVEGNLTCNAELNVSGTITVNGDMIIDDSLRVYSGKVYVDGDMNVPSGFIYMSSKKSYISVKGNFDYTCINNSATMTYGTLEIGGNITIPDCFVAKGEHRTVLNGDSKQTITAPEASFGIFELKNYSDEGVYSTHVLNKEQLIRNGCKLVYEGVDGEFGWTLMGDEVWEGDLIIIDDTLDLNGHTLTVTGDFIQTSGAVVPNGGRLNVNGNYRMQNRIVDGEAVTYGIGSGMLLMNNDSDYINIAGDFVVQTNICHIYGYYLSENNKIQAGTIEVAGNIQIYNDDENIDFGMGGTGKLILSGDKQQSIISSKPSNKITWVNIDYINTSGAKILTNAQMEFCGTVNIQEGGFSQPVLLRETCTIKDNRIAGDVKIGAFFEFVDDNQEPLDLVFDGNVYNDSSCDIQGKITVNGDLSGMIYASNESAHIIVNGNMNAWIYATNGTVEVKGNVSNIGSYMKGKATLIMSGDQLQTINLDETTHIPTVILNNTSNDGVYSENLFTCDELINLNNTKLVIGVGDYQIGYVLQEDTIITEDYMLGFGVLDLNGYTLTIEGDFIHAGGTVNINGGTLCVLGDYHLQSKAVTKNDTSWSVSGGNIIMNSALDSIDIQGDFLVQQKSEGSCNGITGGYIYISGDVRVIGHPMNIGGDNTVILDGDNYQTMMGCNRLKNLEIKNSYGLIIPINARVEIGQKINTNNTKVDGEIKVKSLDVISDKVFNGDVRLIAANAMKNDVYINGTLSIDYQLDLNGHSLNVKNLIAESILWINKGSLYCESDLHIDYNGKLYMLDSKDYVCVVGKFLFESRYNHKTYLTNGVLELKGDFVQDDDDTFLPSRNHKTILSKKLKSSGKDYIQSISFDNYATNSKFNILVLKKTEDQYVFSRNLSKMANKVLYEIDETVEIEPLKEIKIISVTADSVTMEFVTKEGTDQVAGYQIYRNNKLVGVTSDNIYTDTALSYNTSYTYYAYPYDSNKNMAVASPTVMTTTLGDTTPPTAPSDIYVKGVTGVSITIGWTPGTDNRIVKSYQIYRDGELYDTVIGITEYKDENTDNTKYYEYAIKSVDDAGNISELSSALTARSSTPKIVSTQPADYTKLEGDVVNLKVLFTCLDANTVYTVDMEYYDVDNKSWNKINGKPITHKKQNEETYYASVNWDISGLSRDEYDVRYTVRDADNYTETIRVTYYIDNVAPRTPENAKIYSDNGVLSLSWDISKSVDCDGYKIYRRKYNAGEEYECIVQIGDPVAEKYIDKNVEIGEFYEYAITSIDKSNNESNKVENLVAKVTEDKTAPEIKTATPEAGRINGLTTISVNASDNRAISVVRFYLRKDDDTSWNYLGEKDCSSGVANYDWDTTALKDGIYHIKIVVIDAAGNANAGEFTRRYDVDNTGISKIILKEGDIGPTYVQLKWEDVTETDFGYFQVEQKIYGEYKKVGTEDEILGYNVYNLVPGTSYTFRVVGYDNLGNRGEVSEEYIIKTEKDTISPYITGVYPVSGRYNTKIPLSVSAEDNYAIAYATYQYSYDGVNYNDIKSVNCTAKNPNCACDFDVSKMSEGKIYIRFRVYDKANNMNTPLSDGSEVINEYIIDRTAPDMPENVKANSMDGYIKLSWDMGKEEDLKSYNIYRADGEEGFFYPLRENLQLISYYDTEVEFGKTYKYKIVAVDEAGNVSEYSNEYMATVQKDETKPKILGISPKSESVIGTSQAIKVVATDNACLNNIIVEYQNSQGMWREISNHSVSGRSYLLEDTLNFNGMTEGSYKIRVRAIDNYGNCSDYYEVSYVLDSVAPEATLSSSAGDFYISLSINDTVGEDIAYYEIYRKAVTSNNSSYYVKISTQASTQYTDDDVEPWKDYEYKVRVYDKVGNYSETNTVINYATDTDLVAPVAILPENMRITAGMEFTLDGGESTDNLRIMEYEWDMGDGTILSGSRPKHIYKEEGTYSISLTVKDEAGNQDTATTKAVVMSSDNAGCIELTVTDNKGMRIPYALVYLSDSKDSSMCYRTDGEGKIQLAANIGEYKAAAYKSGYLPKEIEVEVSKFKVNTYTIVIPSGQLVVGDIKIKRMDIQEIIDAGVDVSNPENLNYFEFEATFGYDERPVIITDISIPNQGADGGGIGFPTWGGDDGDEGGMGEDTPPPGSGGSSSFPNIEIKPIIFNSPADVNVEEVPIAAYISTRQTVSWLKDMYMVELGILNAADSNYVITNSTAYINLPEGISLAMTRDGQDNEINLGNIKGQEKKYANWVVKGDTPGKYNISADFKGNLLPFNCDVEAHFTTEQTININNYENVVITIMPEEAGNSEEKNYVQFKIGNFTEYPLYNFSTTIGSYIQPETSDEVYIINPETGERELYEKSETEEVVMGDLTRCTQTPVMWGESVMYIPTLEPGEEIYGTYVTVMPSSDDPENNYYKLVDSMVEVIRGQDLGVTVEVKPINGHINKLILNPVFEYSFYGDPVDVVTGSYVDSYEALSITGDAVISLDLTYNSILYETSGDMGYGWYHNYESYIEEKNGLLYYHFAPGSYAGFMNEESINGNMYGTIENGRLILSDQVYGDTITYKSISSGMENYVLTGHKDGTYVMKTPSGEEYTYNADGKLSGITLEDGNSVKLEHTDNQTIITEAGSGQRLKLSYDNGKLISVSDDYGREARFAYTGDYLTMITNPLGENISYEYDELGRLTKASNNYGEAFVVNTYDDAGRVVKQVNSYGEELTFAYTDTNSGSTTLCTSPTGDTTVECDNRGNILKIIAPDGSENSYTYDQNGNRITASDSGGNTYCYGYDDMGRITEYIDNGNKLVDISYNQDGNITSMASEDGISNITYDDNGRMIYVQDKDKAYSYTYNPDGKLTSITEEGRGTESYTYDSTGTYVTAITDMLGNTTYMGYDSRGNVISVTDPAGAVIAYEYDYMNRVSQVTYPNGGTESYTYDIYGNIASVRDALGNITSYSYDTAGNMTKATYPDGSVDTYQHDISGKLISVTASDGRVIRYEYDSMGNTTAIAYPDGTTEKYTYDSQGHITSVTDPTGLVTEYNYDSTGRLSDIKSPDGQSITAAYNGLDRNISGVTTGAGTSSYSYDSLGNLTSMTDSLGNISSCSYNKWNQLTSTTDANGNVTSYKYDVTGNCTEVTNSDGTVYSISYDSCGRMVSATTKASSGNTVGVYYSYDAMGNVSSYKDELGNVTTYEYDLLGRVTKVVDSEGTVKAQYVYDSMGRVIKETDASGMTVSYTYNKSGMIEKANYVAANKDEKCYSYTYDAMGQLLSVTAPDGVVSSQTYDVMGNLTSVTYPEGGGITFTYDDYYRLTSEKLSIGTTKVYTYNYEGLLEEIKNGRGQSTTYTYDALGRVSSWTDELGTVSYTYDANGNLLTTSEATKDGETNTISRTYDCMNRVTSYTDYKGNTVKYGYDELGNMITLTYPGGEIVRYSYTDAGLMESVTDGEGRKTSYTYDKTGRLLTTTKPDGSVETNTYDELGRLSYKNVTIGDKGEEELLYGYSYTYDQWGNIVSIETKYGEAYSEDEEVTTSTHTMLSSGSSGMGNVIVDGSITTATVSMTYDSSNRMLTYNGEDILYDKDGNMTYGPLDGEMVEFEYDCRNRLVRAGDTTYEYDVENNRIAVETSEYREEYIIDSSNSLNQVLEVERTNKDESENTDDNSDSGNSKTETYYYGYGLIYEKAEDSGILVYHYNHLGSTVAITDEDGNLLLSYDYGTYGEINTTTEYGQNTPKVRFLYNGMMGVITDDNGLYHMRARYYNPQIKRFINQDVLIGNIGNSASLNRYSYVEGNPISYTDPFGLSPYMQAIHAGLDLLGAIPGLEFCDGINAALYFLEGNWTEGLKSLVYMTPGMDLIGKAEKYAVKGGKYAKQALIAAEYATIAGRTMAALMASEDFGKAVSNMIDKYLVYEEDISWVIGVEFLQLVATGTQTVFHTGSMFNIPDELAKYDFDDILNQNIKARYETTAVDGYMSGEEIQFSSLNNVGRVSRGSLNEGTFTRYLADGRQVTDVTILPSSTGVKIPRRLTTEEMTFLTQEYGVEFAQVYRYGSGVNGGGGQYYLYSGTVNRVTVPVGKDIMLINHTHPGGTAYPSPADKDLLGRYQQFGSPQRSSEIIPIGKQNIRFNISGLLRGE